MDKKKIAVFANGWSNEFIAHIVEGLKKEAAADGVDIFVFLTYIFFTDSNIQSKCQLNIFHLPRPEDFDGAIMLTNTFNLSDEEERICALFQKSGIPMISTEVKVPGMAYIGTGNYEGVYEMTKHLMDVHDVKRVVYVSGIEGNDENAIRRQALEDALKERGLAIEDTIRGDFGFYNAQEELKKWVAAGHEMPDAFVCANDHMALGISSTLDHLGYEVPKDVIVTGFDHIAEAQSSFPLVATVSRRWSKMGKYLYEELKEQIKNPDPAYEKIYDSVFVPSESCGCKPSTTATRVRLEKVKNHYYETTMNDMLDIFFQNLRIAMAKVESKEDFYEVAKREFGNSSFMGPDFWICTEPLFFEMDDDKYPRRIRGYSKTMDVIYGKHNGEPIVQTSFQTHTVVPGYHKVDGESNTYFIAPLNNMEFIIGYVVIKNDTEFVYNLNLRKWISNINSLFITIRQYIFAQETNRKLTQIYMTDFLTGMYNRTGCEKVLYSFIEENRKRGMSSVLLFADINRMKIINDVYGHLNGDLAIKATSDAMKKSLPEGWLFGRYGGDEFIAVGICTNPDLVPMQRENLDNMMKAYINTLNLSFSLSASVGYSIILPEDEGSIEDFINRADESMYEEKERAHKLLDMEMKKRSEKDN